MFKTNKLATLLIASIIGALIIMDGFFVLDQRKYGIVFQFGEAVRVIKEPGLKLKIPFINEVVMLDKRLCSIESISKELTTADGKRIIIDAFGKFVINDPVLFYKKMNNRSTGERMLESAMRQVIGRMQLTDLFSDKRSGIMSQIKDWMNHDAPNYGIQIVDVRIVHADFPAQNSQSIYRRMETDRIKESMQIRAEGAETATRITSETDKEVAILLAEAVKDSEMLKAEADRKALEILTEVYAKDYEFYSIYKQVQNYHKMPKAKIVISPQGSFMNPLGFSRGK